MRRLRAARPQDLSIGEVQALLSEAADLLERTGQAPVTEVTD